MTTRGRGPERARLVQRLDGSATARARLTALLEALAGRRTVAQACQALGLGERRFHALRTRALQAALDSLEPRPAGRPARAEKADPRLAGLEKTIRELRLELRAAQIRGRKWCLFISSRCSFGLGGKESG